MECDPLGRVNSNGSRSSTDIRCPSVYGSQLMLLFSYIEHSSDEGEKLMVAPGVAVSMLSATQLMKLEHAGPRVVSYGDMQTISTILNMTSRSMPITWRTTVSKDVRNSCNKASLPSSTNVSFRDVAKRCTFTNAKRSYLSA